ncbi:hypothetical protein PVAND_001425 [Polypedilum vanderplanki]|uniref:Uncharacterized protein n=1 Tax=Polypedilum vanderplanki TaxID=319348 RepID=A0A9J6BND4_POLVA|nr:hypothetical protein PVAND_001425 [Polypedilum vanderplanki]
MANFKNIFIFTLIALFYFSQVSSISIDKLTKKKKTTTEAPNSEEVGDYCANGGIPPYCCANGSTSKYCCANNSNSPYCCKNGSTSRYCCANNSRYSDCRDEKKKKN